MVRSLFVLLLFAASLLPLQGCTWNHSTDLDCDPGVVTFSGAVQPILTRACTGERLGDCHQPNTLNGDYTNFTVLKARIDDGKFQSRVLELKNMPPDYSRGPVNLSKCELEKIQIWINDGAPQN